MDGCNDGVVDGCEDGVDGCEDGCEDRVVDGCEDGVVDRIGPCSTVTPIAIFVSINVLVLDEPHHCVCPDCKSPLSDGSSCRM
jgi:hypothetical protein